MQESALCHLPIDAIRPEPLDPRMGSYCVMCGHSDEEGDLHRRIREVAEGIASTLRAEAEITIGPGVQACVNDPEIAALMRHAAEATVGADHIPAGDQRQSVSDDMALFLDAVPGCYILVGAGNPERGIAAPHHNARFDLDEACLGIGVEVMARAALDYLS